VILAKILSFYWPEFQVKFKLYVWGGISCHGPSDFAVLTSNTDAEMYDRIIKKCIFPFSAQKYRYNCFIHQDNDAKHTSKLCMAAIKQLKIMWIRSPPLSPDLNPIELVWAYMKRFSHKRLCASVAEQRKAVQDFRKHDHDARVLRKIRVPTEKSNHQKKRRLVKLLIFLKVFSLFFYPILSEITQNYFQIFSFLP
jgi:hypothetical protein